MTFTINKDKKRVCISCGYETSLRDRCPQCGCVGYRRLPDGSIEMRFNRSGMRGFEQPRRRERERKEKQPREEEI
jgi:hypothetical protein